MGIYIYTLRKSAPRQTGSGPVYRYRFSERYTHGTYRNGNGRLVDEGAAQRSREARHVERWEGYIRSGEVAGPVLTCVEGDEWSEVYSQETPDAVWSDCDKIPGRFVGYLVRKGRKWAVRSLESALVIDRSLLDSYITTHNLWPEVGVVNGRIQDQVMAHYEVAYAHWKAPHFRNNCLHWPATGSSEYVVGQRLEQCYAHARRAQKAAEAKAKLENQQQAQTI